MKRCLPARRLGGLALLCCVTLPAIAELPDALPPPGAVHAALQNHPRVHEAASLQQAQNAQRAALQASPHDWVVRLGGQQRRSMAELQPTQRDREWNVALERAWRLPGKARVDAALGDSGVARADDEAHLAWHDTAEALLAAWFDWLREKATLDQWTAQLRLARQQASAVERRQQLGDAARIEREAAAAMLAQAENRHQQSQSRLRQAQGRLQRLFPQLPLETVVELPLPTALAGNRADWRQQLLASHPALQLAQRQSEYATLQARRSTLEKQPDPTVGMQFSRERSGDFFVARTLA